ncbi:hypothetical protein P154DRAFT_529073 [Amniculicola lignicola CBS 123094]|uniref:Uncharacterized protein n=1 Tax=Amniculicola lignicola CBS 123094 TaxID=1392246 RepID=A0A6A5X3F8_9PLEO|nr:hypothetical protein P154DRAFT_529073 [Amniculicola lignicola CBS 123094]
MPRHTPNPPLIPTWDAAFWSTAPYSLPYDAPERGWFAPVKFLGEDASEFFAGEEPNYEQSFFEGDVGMTETGWTWDAWEWEVGATGRDRDRDRDRDREGRGIGERVAEVRVKEVRGDKDRGRAYRNQGSSRERKESRKERKIQAPQKRRVGGRWVWEGRKDSAGGQMSRGRDVWNIHKGPSGTLYRRNPVPKLHVPSPNEPNQTQHPHEPPIHSDRNLRLFSLSPMRLPQHQKDIPLFDLPSPIPIPLGYPHSPLTQSIYPTSLSRIHILTSKPGWHNG